MSSEGKGREARERERRERERNSTRPPSPLSPFRSFPVDCGWLYTQRAPFAEWKGKCPVCRAPKSRFKPYAGSNTSNDEKARLARMGGGGGAALGGRRASGEGVEGSDAGKLAGFAVAAVVIAGGLYLALNSAL